MKTRKFYKVWRRIMELQSPSRLYSCDDTVLPGEYLFTHSVIYTFSEWSWLPRVLIDINLTIFNIRCCGQSSQIRYCPVANQLRQLPWGCHKPAGVSLNIHDSDRSYCPLPVSVHSSDWTISAYIWWRHDVETLSALLVLCGENRKGQHKCGNLIFLCCLPTSRWTNSTVTANLRLNTLMWRHCNQNFHTHTYLRHWCRYKTAFSNNFWMKFLVFFRTNVPYVFRMT